MIDREAAALLIAWGLVLAGELWFASVGMVPPEPWRVGGEVLCLALVAANHLRFATGWARSPLLPGAALVGVTLLVTTSVDPARRLLLGAGIAVVVVALLRGLHPLARRAPIVVALAATPIASASSRYLLLAMHAGDDRDAVAAPLGELVAELRPFRARGTGSSGPRIALVTIDTLRWDRLVRTETWRRLAARGRTWDRAMSTSSWTLPAMASLATGLPVEGHGAIARPNGGYQGIRPEIPTLARSLSDAGYTTAAVFTNAWMSRELGFADGFDRFLHLNRNRPHRMLVTGVPATPAWTAPAVVDRAIREADALPARGAFLWVHFVDPHQPYTHAEDEVAGALEDGRLRGGLLVDEAGRDAVRAAYDREVRLLDAELMRLLDHLEATGWADGVLALTADHGEELWDHGGVEHGHSHHGEVVDVGLALVAPGVPPGPGAGVASLVDVTSTLRAAAGLPANGLDLREGVPADRVATAWGNAHFRHDASVRAGDWRVLARGDGTVVAYDLARDPGEQVPITLPDDHPLVVRAKALRGPEVRDAAEIDREALEALGYLE